jgi:hypothetical protein
MEIGRLAGHASIKDFGGKRGCGDSSTVVHIMTRKHFYRRERRRRKNIEHVEMMR